MLAAVVGYGANGTAPDTDLTAITHPFDAVVDGLVAHQWSVGSQYIQSATRAGVWCQQLTVESELAESRGDRIRDEHRLSDVGFRACAPAPIAQPLRQRDHPVFEFAIGRQRGLL
jgi:hypothetical protein